MKAYEVASKERSVVKRLSMKAVIPVFAMYSTNIFFAVSGLFGFEYTGIENSRIYLFYTLAVAFLSVCLFLISLLKRATLSIREITVLLIPASFSVFFMISGFQSGTLNATATLFFLYFLLWSLPSISAALYVTRENLLFELEAWFEVLMLLYSLSIALSVVLPALQGTYFRGFAGATHQTASSVSAVALGLNLFFLFVQKRDSGYLLRKFPLTRVLFTALLPIQVLGVLIPGGRSGSLLAIVYLVVTFVLIVGNKCPGRKRKIILHFFVFLMVLILIGNYVLQRYPAVFSGFARAFEYVGPNLSLNWQGTSNRDIVFSDAIQLIEEKPIFGYGLFGFWNVSGYPHNFILEILLQGGIMYFGFIVVGLILLLRRLKYFIRANKDYFLLYILLQPATLLMFSGTYLTNSEFWFVMTLLFVLRMSPVSERTLLYDNNTLSDSVLDC